MNLLQWILRYVLGSTSKPAPKPPTPPAPTPFAEDLLKLHNAARREAHRGDLVFHPALNRAAQRYAETMAALKNHGHDVDGTTFDERARREGYDRATAENVAAGHRTPAEVFAAWMKSPGHNANILDLDNYDVGFGRAAARDGTLYWCAVFGGF